ncbi:MAG TPA: hypothetical protein PJ982_16470, partial [Lacipirellulaceae bacterium]|nr:hypothetical protein [Lacipirellulaceae bacterium]
MRTLLGELVETPDVWVSCNMLRRNLTSEGSSHRKKMALSTSEQDRINVAPLTAVPVAHAIAPDCRA